MTLTVQGYITPDPIMARLTERGARFMGIPPGIGANAGGFGLPYLIHLLKSSMVLRLLTTRIAIWT